MSDTEHRSQAASTALHKAIVALDRMKARLEAAEGPQKEPIAVVGLACRLPGGATSVEALTTALLAGLDAVSEVPAERWTPDPAARLDPVRQGERFGAFLEDVFGFDHEYFGVSRREAEKLDPQQRLMLELVVEALERAGIPPTKLTGTKTGVFVGLMNTDAMLLAANQPASAWDGYTATGAAHCFTAGRIAFTFGFQGPAMVVDTACSSSLVAVHLGLQSLRQKESDVAIVGGVNLMLAPIVTEMTTHTGALAADGRCKAFDARANGYVRGEGAIAIVLKRLSDAVRDRDPVLGLLRGSAVNQDGRSTGLTTPNVKAQEALLRHALESARVAPEDVDYVECHGTGTPLGDPIEVEALRAVFAGRARPIVLGAVKTNVGHLEAAAGLAGLTKVLGALAAKVIPANLHLRVVNPRLPLEGSPFVLPRASQPWLPGDKPRLAGVSAFGLSGTNAHVVVEEPPRAGPASAGAAPEGKLGLLPLSARSPAALRALAEACGQALGGLELADVLYTGAHRRDRHGHRLAVVGASVEELAARLTAFARDGEATGVSVGVAPSSRGRVVFVFPGQGAQWLGMGRKLHAAFGAFRDALAACDEAVRREAGFSVVAELFADEACARLAEIDVVQPVLFALEVALAALWRHFGVVPDVVVGHSMGEVAAAHVAGVLTLEDAARVICRRSRLLRRFAGRGAMALVELSIADATEALRGREDRLGIGVSNGPRSTVISGEVEPLDAILAELSARGVFCRRVKVDVASHSPMMDPLLDELRTALAEVRPRPAVIPLRSTVTGTFGAELDAAYWCQNLRQPVLFGGAIGELLARGDRLFVELSPHPVLLPAIEEHFADGAALEGARAIASLRRDSDEPRVFFDGLGALHAGGASLDWSRLAPDARVAALPTYPWQRTRLVVRPAARVQTPEGRPAADHLAGVGHEIVWERQDLKPSGRVRGPWLVYQDRGGLGARLSTRLEAEGETVVRVLRGPAFRQVGDATFEVDVTRREDHGAVLQATGGRCRVVVWLAALDAEVTDATTAEALREAEREGTLGALRLVQALAGRSSDKPTDASSEGPVRLHLVTRRGVATARPALAGASLVGVGRTIALEHPELGCRRYDLDPRGADVDLLVHELLAESPEAEVAWRGAERFVARLRATELASSPAPAMAPDRTYLVTGGLGALGRSLASWLVDRGARHLVLMGRRAPSKEAEVELAALRARGVKVEVFAGDVARRVDVDAVLRALTLPLAGVFHAAGARADRTIGALDEAAFFEALEAKVLGAWNLHQATRGLALDHFVSYSSAVVLTGLPGTAAYAAANTFLDGLSTHRAALGLPAVSIQWGLFAGRGLAADAGRLTELGAESLSEGDGRALLDRILARPKPVVAAARLSVERWLERFPHAASFPYFSALGTVGASSRAPAEAEVRLRKTLAGTAPTARREALERHLRGRLARILRTDGAGLDRRQRFEGWGFDSLMGLELRNHLQRELELELSVADVLAHPTIEALAGLLAERTFGRESQLADADAPIPPARPAPTAPGSWVVIPRPVPNARLRLLCFPYAGGAASIYATWAAGLPAEVELCAIQPPGRHERAHEPFAETIEAWVDALVPALLPYLDRPFAAFGHCLGAITMFETLRVLGEAHGRHPLIAFASGAPAPERYLVPVAKSERQAFQSMLRLLGFARDEVLADADAERSLMPVVHADFGVAARYVCRAPEAVLDAPIATFASTDDPFATLESVEPWRIHTRRWCSRTVLPGGHYFIVPERDRVLASVSVDLLGRLALLERGEGTVRRARKRSTASAKVRLYVIAGAFEAALDLEPWADALGADVDVVSLDLPGYGASRSRLPLTRVEDMVEHLGPAIEDDHPWALLGHDLGALVAYELTCARKRAGRPSPGHLFVSGAMAPGVHTFAATHHLPRTVLLGLLETRGIEAAELPEERVLRASLAALSTYAAGRRRPIDVALTAVVGADDALVPRAAAERWGEATEARFTLEVLEGGHALRGRADHLARVVRDTLTR